jgi:hypothetical protein
MYRRAYAWCLPSSRTRCVCSIIPSPPQTFLPTPTTGGAAAALGPKPLHGPPAAPPALTLAAYLHFGVAHLPGGLLSQVALWLEPVIQVRRLTLFARRRCRSEFSGRNPVRP